MRCEEKDQTPSTQGLVHLDHLHSIQGLDLAGFVVQCKHLIFHVRSSTLLGLLSSTATKCYGSVGLTHVKVRLQGDASVLYAP